MGSSLPCPAIDFTTGWNDWLAAAYGLNGTVEQHFGVPFNPFQVTCNWFIMKQCTLCHCRCSSFPHCLGCCLETARLRHGRDMHVVPPDINPIVCRAEPYDAMSHVPPAG